MEETPIARWGEMAFSITREGYSTPQEAVMGSLPLLTGPEGSAPALMAKYQRLVGILAPLNLSVEQLAVDERGQVEAVLVRGMQLNLGDDRFSRAHAPVRRDLSQLNWPGARVKLRRVDLRYESGVAVAFQESPPVAGL